MTLRPAARELAVPLPAPRRILACVSGAATMLLVWIAGAYLPGDSGALAAIGALLAVGVAAYIGGLLPGLAITVFGGLAQAFLLLANHSLGMGGLLSLLAYGIVGTWASRSWEAMHSGRQQAQAELQLEKQRRLAVDESLQDFAIARVSANGLVADWSRGAEQMFGYSAVEVVGRHLSRLYPMEALHRSGPERDLEEAGSLRRYETEGWRIRRDGSAFWATVVFTRQPGTEGGPGGWLMVCRDTTAARVEQEQLLRSQRRLRDLAAHLESVREAERTHIAREIHDELGQALTCLKMHVAWCQPRLAEGQAPVAERLLAMRTQVDETITTVRRIATELRPKVLDELGLAEAIEWQAREFSSRTGIECTIDCPMPQFSLDRERSTAMFRVFQETLTNVARHAAATRVSVAVYRRKEELELMVQDNGRGITEQELEGSASLGLLGIRERIAAFRGSVVITGKPGLGTQVVVNLPWAGEDELHDPYRRR